MKKFDTSLYFITDSTGFSEEEFLRRIEAALRGSVTLLQLREKDKTTRKYLDLARKILGPDKIIGATAKTVPQALEAYQQGADYLGVGAIYPTTTKVKTVLTSTDTHRDICAADPNPGKRHRRPEQGQHRCSLGHPHRRPLRGIRHYEGR